MSIFSLMNTDTFYRPKEWISIVHNLRVVRESMPYLDISEWSK